MSRRNPFSKSVGWHQSQIDDEKRAIKAELDAAPGGAYSSSRLKIALERMGALENDDSDAGRLRRYIFGMSALVHHERYGGLTEHQVERIVEMAYAILRTQGLKPTTSRLAALYGDLHLILSQIRRRSGKHWAAAWEQQLACRFSGALPSGGLGFPALAMANRALRLGHAKVAIAEFSRAENSELPTSIKERTRLGLVQALRLSGALAESDRAAADAAGWNFESGAIVNELQWEAICREVQRSHDLTPMLFATSRRGSHYQASYVVEMCLWGMALPSRNYEERLPRLRSLRRNKLIRPADLGFFYTCAATLQDCYDTDIPLILRIRRLGEALAELSELTTVDKVLLVWAAATRWLARSKSLELAKLAASEYEALSFRLSDGRGRDVLGIMAEMSADRWIDAG